MDELIKSQSILFKGINFDLDSLLINNNIEDIQALIYQEIKKEKWKKKWLTMY